jgi:glycine oxidase
VTGSRIVIVGGGITGAFTAFTAARRGAAVTLIERDGIAAHASGHNAGGLNPMHGAGIPGPLHALALASLRLHADHRDELLRRSGGGIAGGARPVNRLHVALAQNESDTLQARRDLYEATPGFSARWLKPAELRELEPRLSGEVIGGLWTVGNAHVDPAPYTRAVAAAAVSLGARLLSAAAVGLRHDEGRVSAVETDAGAHDCDGVVIAPGPWADEPAQWLGIALPVAPLKGQLLLAETDSGAPAADISWGEIGVYAAGPGRLILGGTEERSGFDESPTASARELILAGARRLLTGIGELRVLEHWAGLRPVTPDGLPIVGIPSGWENVCVAAGSGRKGMLYSAALARAATDLLLDGETALPVEACAPEREALV